MSSSSKSPRDYSRKYKRAILEPWSQSHNLPPSPPSHPPHRTPPTFPITTLSSPSPPQNLTQNQIIHDLNELHHLSNLFEINLQQAIEATNLMIYGDGGCYEVGKGCWVRYQSLFYPLPGGSRVEANGLNCNVEDSWFGNVVGSGEMRLRILVGKVDMDWRECVIWDVRVWWWLESNGEWIDYPNHVALSHL
ncbi:retrovirus-related pol polyprotein from transposon TNT 1-94 [Tanacetum coccineum]